MRTLRDAITTSGPARVLRWGRHEGIRGATWTEVRADGKVGERRYLPNPELSSTSTPVGNVDAERFGALLEQVLAIPAAEVAELLQTPPLDHAVSLEAAGDGWSWDLTFPPHRLEATPPSAPSARASAPSSRRPRPRAATSVEPKKNRRAA